MNSRLFARLSPALLLVLVALVFETGQRVKAQEPQQPFVQAIGTVPVPSAEGTTQFVLRAPADRVAAIAARHGLTVIGPVDEHAHDVFLVTGPATFFNGTFNSSSQAPAQQLVESVQSDPDVGHFEPNAVVVTPEVPAGIDLNHSTVEILDALNNRTLVSYFGAQVWNAYVNQPAANAIRLSQSHATAGTGAGIVAIIDTGVDPDHPLLQGSLVPGYDFVNDTAGTASEWNDLDHSTVEILDHSTVEILDSGSIPVPLNPSTVAVMNTAAPPLDPTTLPAAFGHGTMVAGLVHLVAPTAKIMPLKAFHADGTSRVYDIIRAVYYAVDHGARVINMSFSSTVPSAELARAIDYATNNGVICVASAGNLGQELVVYPGALRNVLGVASSNSAGTPIPSSFSNFGDALVSLAAPGEAVITTYPGGGYAGVWGTSFSAPLVAGGAALLLQIDPTLDQHKADDQFGKAVRMAPGMGKGRLNLYEAVRTLPDRTPPVVSMMTPANGGAVSGSILISASASDNVSVAGVKFLLDDSPLGDEDTVAPYELAWTTSAASNGTHIVTAIARDAAGNVASNTSSVTLSNDLEAPTVALTSPAAGAIVGGNVTLTATASDDTGVIGVLFKLDGAALGVEDTVAPYELAWTTDSVPDGSHVLTAVARDEAGHETASTVSVTVSHDTAAPAVALSSPGAGTTVNGTVTVTATASDDVGVISVQFLLNGTALGAADSAAPYETAWSTEAATNGTHSLSAVARDAAGRETTASIVSVTVTNDMAAPAVSVTTPGAGTTLGGTVTVTAAASDDVGVVSVQFLVDGAPLDVADVAAPYEVAWPTTTAANGAHTLTALARDAAGHETTSTAVIVAVTNDTAAPTVAITSPSASTSIGGTVTVAATASDDVGVISVQFLVDGAPLGDLDGAAPYEVVWSTTTVPNGTHTLTAVARDAAEHETTASSVSVTVTNDIAAPTVVVTSPTAGTTVGGMVTLTATASDDVNVVGVQFKLDGVAVGVEDDAVPYELPWATTATSNGAHTVTAVARDAAGHEAVNTISVTVLNDMTAPTVALSSPTAGTTVGGTVTVSASASDDVGVVSVQFLLDGVALGAADASAPYEVEWPTTAAVNGAHTLAVVARDAAGHATTSTANVAVMNDTTAPTVALTSPAAGTTVGETVTVTATASDDVGVTSVQFLLDGAALGAADGTAPYGVAWPTGLTTNGTHTLTAVARDAAGHDTTATVVTVIVLNDTTAPTVALTNPISGATVSGTVTVTATALDNVGVVSVDFLVNGAPLALGATDTAAPYQVNWLTTTVANGPHIVTAVARDAAGNETTTSAAVTVTNLPE